MEHGFDALDGITLVVTGRGDATPANIHRMRDALFDEVDRKGYRRLLFDVRDVRDARVANMQFDVEDVIGALLGIVGLLEYRGDKDARIAILGAKKPAKSTIPVAHFATREEAETWLSLLHVPEAPRVRHLTVVNNERQAQSPSPASPASQRAPWLRVISNSSVEAPARPVEAVAPAEAAGLLEKIERLLAQVRAAGYEPDEKPGRPRASIVAAFARRELVLPPDLATFYAWRDGLWVGPSMFANSLHDALDCHDMLANMVECDPNWFPVFSMNGDVHLCVDLSTGAVHSIDPECDRIWQVASHYTQCIDALLEGFENGAFVYDEESGGLEPTTEYAAIRAKHGVEECW